MNKFVRRQLRTTALLALALALILGLALYMHWVNSFEEEKPATSATQEDIAEALIRYKTLPEDEAAQLYVPGDSAAQPFELVFTGLPGADAADRLVQLLTQHQLQPAFYLTLSEAANANESIALLLARECSVGILGSGSSSVLSDADPEAMVKRLCRITVILHARQGVVCDTLLTTAQPSTESLRAAAAVGIERVVVSTHQIDLTDCLTVEAAAALVEDIPRGAVVRVCISRKDADPAAGLAYLLEAMERYADQAPEEPIDLATPSDQTPSA